MGPTIETPVDFLEEMANFAFPSSTQEKLDDLMDKNNDGKLTDSEKNELKALVELNERVSLVKARARLILKEN